ncbi:MAG: inorganic diphosphatase [Planctomycetota bacterium]|nr:inorganic diphosphatase [Planctomycetota bacterium]
MVAPNEGRLPRPLGFAIPLLVLLPACGARAEEAVTTRIEGDVHLLDGYPARAADGRLNVVIEVPAGTLAKWEVDAESGVLEWETKDGARRVVQFLAYPGNYGMVPSTLHSKESGGDGDPLDVIVLGASEARGALVPVTPIGVLGMLDGGELDEKIVAVASDTPFDEVASIEELDERFPGATEILATWFASYKGPGETQLTGFDGPKKAAALIEEAISDYAARGAAKSPR